MILCRGRIVAVGAVVATLAAGCGGSDADPERFCTAVDELAHRIDELVASSVPADSPEAIQLDADLLALEDILPGAIEEEFRRMGDPDWYNGQPWDRDYDQRARDEVVLTSWMLDNCDLSPVVEAELRSDLVRAQEWLDR